MLDAGVEARAIAFSHNGGPRRHRSERSQREGGTYGCARDTPGCSALHVPA